LARAYFEHRKATINLHPRYRFLCPTECEKGFNEKRRTKCDTCPLKSKEEDFKAKTLKAWRAKLGRKASKFNFERMFSLMSTVAGLEDKSTDQISAKNYFYLSIYLSEKNYAQAKDDHAAYIKMQNG
jgi:hypothetical protein